MLWGHLYLQHVHQNISEQTVPNNVAHTAKGKEPATVLLGFVMKVVITDWAGDNAEQA